MKTLISIEYSLTISGHVTVLRQWLSEKNTDYIIREFESQLHIVRADHQPFGKWSKKVVRFPIEKKKTITIRIRTQSRQTSADSCPFHKFDRKMANIP